jgi:hypothetical protein
LSPEVQDVFPASKRIQVSRSQGSQRGYSLGITIRWLAIAFAIIVVIAIGTLSATKSKLDSVKPDQSSQLVTYK